MLHSFCIRYINIWVVGLLIFAIPFCSIAQPAKLQLDKSSILIGEPIKLTLVVTHTSGSIVNVLLPDSLPHFEIIKKQSTDSNAYLFKQQIVFTSFDSGTFYFPPLVYSIDGQKAYTDSLAVQVGYMPIDSTNSPRDVKNIIEVSVFNWSIVWAIVAILLGIMVLYWVYLFIKNRQSKVALPTALDYYNSAIHALSLLQTENKNNTISVKDFHTQVASIFKKYCGQVLHQNMYNSTTTEVLNKLAKYALDADKASNAAMALYTGDAVKFAKYNPSNIDNENALLYIKNAIIKIHQSPSKK